VNHGAGRGSMGAFGAGHVACACVDDCESELLQ
jgi:hypothetical protein